MAKANTASSATVGDTQSTAMWVGGVDYIQGNMVQSAGSDLNFDFHNAVL